MKRPPELEILDPGYTGWANLGLWADSSSYPDAARALARWVGGAARLSADERVADLGCGEGASLDLWSADYGVDAIGYDPRVAHPAPRIVRATAETADLGAELDAVVSVDAAYHFDHVVLFDRCAAALGPGGRFVWTDFIRDDLGRVERIKLKLAAQLFGLGREVPMDHVGLERAMKRAGLRLETTEDLTTPVLLGFAEHIDALGAQGRLRGPGATKLRITANACRRVQAHGVRYVGLVARRIR
ncbi:MAG: methyltransferase domain-containing protein [Deltaproteobacteria bacterium]